MLRQRLSSGMLRARAQAQAQIIPPVPAVPASYAAPTRGIASSTLRTSTENWQGKTVKSLKESLSQRGLPQYGNKATLVSRLQDYEASQAGPASSSRTAAFSASLRLPQSRSVSSSPSSSAAKPKTPKIPTAPSPAPPAPTVQPPDSLLSPDVKVDNKNVLKEDDVDASVAPGLPSSGSAQKRVIPKTVQFPVYEDKEEQLAVPPFTPDNFNSDPSLSMSPPTPSPDVTKPRVMTVSSTSTHLDEGPRHSLHATSDPHDHEGDLDSSEESGEHLAAEIKEYALSNVFSKLRIPTFGSEGVKVPELTTDSKKTEFKPIERGLNDEEKTGAFWLAGILVGGFLLGGVANGSKSSKSTKEEASELAKKAKDAVGGAAVKGDALWEKASGAGVVGHGARKN